MSQSTFCINNIYIGRRLVFIMANVDGKIRIGIELEEQGYKRTLSELKKSATSTTKDLEKLFNDMGKGMSLDKGVAEFQRIQMSMSKITQQTELLRERFKGLNAIKLTLGAEDVNRSLTRARLLTDDFYDLLETQAPEISVRDEEFKANLADAQRRYNDFISELSNTDIDLDIDGMDTIDLFGDTSFDAELADVRRSLSGFLDNIDFGSISRDAKGIDTINSKIDELKRKRDTLNKALQRGIISDVEFQADTKEVNETIKELEKEKVSIEVELESDDNSLNSLNNENLKFGDLVNADLLVESIKKLASSLRDLGSASLDSGANFQSAYLRIKDTFGEASKSIYDYAQASTELLGMSETSFMQSASAIGVFAKSYIKDTNQLASVTAGLTTAIADVSAQTGFSIDETMQKVLSGLRGNTEAIEELGINVKVADMQNWLNTQGIDASFENLNSEMQNLYRTWYMLEKVASNGAMGYSAKMMKTYSGQVKLLKANFDELKTTMGTYLMQALVPVIKVVNVLLSKLVDLANVIGEVFGLKDKYTLATDISISAPDIDTSAYDDAISSISGVTDAQSDLTKETEKSAKAAKKALAPFHQLNILQNNDSGSDSGSGSSSKTPDVSMPDVGSALSSISGNTKEWVSPLEKFIDSLSKSKLTEKVLKIKESISDLIKTLKDFSPLLEGIATAVGIFIGASVLGGLFKKLVALKGVSKLIEIVSSAFGVFKASLASGAGIFSSAGKALGSLWASFKIFMKGLSPLAKTVVTIASLAAVFVTFRNAIKNLTLSSYIKETGEFSVTWDNLKTALANMIPIFAIAGAAIYAMFGPIGLVATAVVGLIAAFAGYNSALQELTNKRVDEIFSHGTVSIKDYTNSILESNNGMLALIDTVSTTTESLASNAEKLPSITSEIDFLAGKIGFLGDESGELKAQMDEALGNLATLAKEQVEVLSKSISETLTPEMEDLATQAGLTKDEINELLYGVDSTTQSNIDKATEELKALNGVTEADRTPEQTARIEQLTSWLSEAANGLSDYTNDWQSSINEINATSLNFKDSKEGIEYFEDSMAKLLGDVSGTKEDVLLQYDEKIRQIAEDPYLTPEEKQKQVDNLNILKASADLGFDKEIASIQGQVEEGAKKIGEGYVGKFKEALDKEMSALTETGWWDITKLDPFHTKEDNYNILRDKAMENVSKAFKDKVGYTPEGIDEWIDGWKPDTTVPATNIVDSFESKLNSYGDTKDFYGNIITSGSESAKKLAWNTGESIGNNTSDGLEEGINENAYKAEDASEDMAKGVEDAAREALDTHSPSKVFNEIGSDVDNGLAGGIFGNKNAPVIAMSILVNDLVNTFSDTDKFKSIGSSIASSISNGITEKAPSLLETVRGVFNDMAGLGDKFLVNFGSTISTASSKLADVKTPDKLPSAATAISNLRIPKLANGAVLSPNQSFLAMVGDQTKGVNVEAPLETIKAGLRSVLAEGSGDGGDTYVYAQFGDEAIEGVVANVVRRAKVTNNGR